MDDLFLGWLLPHTDKILLGFVGVALLVDLARRGGAFDPDPARAYTARDSYIANAAVWGLNNLLVLAGLLSLGWVQQGYDAVGIPRVDPGFWAAFPWWAQLLVVVLAYDLADYWNHRLMHLPALWPIHALHHSAPALNVLNTFRVHFLEAIFMGVFYVVSLSWLSLPPGALGGAYVLLKLHNMYVHLDLDIGHGPLTPFLASPRFHRWHHADDPQIYGKNLANVFPFWDWLFGTWHLPGAYRGPLGARNMPVNEVLPSVLWTFQEFGRMAVGRGTQGAFDRRARAEPPTA